MRARLVAWARRRLAQRRELTQRRLSGPVSLRRRLVLTTLGSTVVCWLMSLALIVSVAWSETSDVFDDSLEESARMVAALSASMQKRGELDDDEGDSSIDDIRRVRLYYQVVSEEGEILRRSRRVPDEPFVSHVDEDNDFYNVWLDGRAWRVYARHVPDQDFFVQVAQPWDARTELLEEMAESLTWPALALLAVLGIVNWLVIRRLLQPLERMAQEIGDKSPSDLSAVPTDGQAREFRLVVDALNGVLGRLGTALQSERRFTADAAHELRTPLAALRMKIQLMQRQQAQSLAAGDMATSLQGLRDDVDRCTSLVENLLALARLDPQVPGTLPLAEVDAKALVDAAIGDGAALWRSHQQRVEADVRVEHILGHQELLRSALRNLLDNAARYSHPGGRIRIEVFLVSSSSGQQDQNKKRDTSKRISWVRVAVRDDGPGVSAEDREQLTQRFFRALGSNQPGSGLGLSIVERIVELHGGKLVLEDGLDGRGLSVVMTWPAGR